MVNAHARQTDLSSNDMGRYVEVTGTGSVELGAARCDTASICKAYTPVSVKISRANPEKFRLTDARVFSSWSEIVKSHDKSAISRIEI